MLLQSCRKGSKELSPCSSPHYRCIFPFPVLTFLIMTIGIIFSYGRAAWISVVVALGVFIAAFLRIRFYWIALVASVIIGFFVIFQQQILDRLEKNKQDSSANFVEHIQSIYNISSDASNLERINRWQAAIRMFNDRPISAKEFRFLNHCLWSKDCK